MCGCLQETAQPCRTLQIFSVGAGRNFCHEMIQTHRDTEAFNVVWDDGWSDGRVTGKGQRLLKRGFVSDRVAGRSSALLILKSAALAVWPNKSRSQARVWQKPLWMSFTDSDAPHLQRRTRDFTQRAFHRWPCAESPVLHQPTQAEQFYSLIFLPGNNSFMVIQLWNLV